MESDRLPGLPRAVRDRMAIDPRALGAFRIGLGTLLILDYLLRTRNLMAFYTDAGVLPRSVLAAHHPLSATFSLHALSGGAWAQLLLFAVGIVVAGALLVGYHTRMATAISVVLLLSLHARNPHVLNGGDLVLRHLLIWSLLLPLGGRWALDARREGSWVTPSTGLPAAGLLLQVVIVYVVNAFWKAKGDLWLGGDAVRYVFELDMLTWLLGPVIADWPALLVAINYAWLGLVAVSPALLLLTGWRRTLLILAFALAHLGMALTIRLGLFPFVMLVALVPFLPPTIWDRFDRLRGAVPVARSSTPAGELGPTARRVAASLAGVAIVGMVLWHAVALGALGPAVAGTGPVSQSDHSWRMFAPDPLQADIGYEATGGTTANDTRDLAVPLTATARWRKYLGAHVPEKEHLVRPFVAWRCATAEPSVTQLTLVEIRTPVVLDGHETPHRRVRWDGRCPT